MTTTQDVNLTGHVDYDLDQLTPLLRTYLGPGAKLTSESREFAFRGSLADAPPRPSADGLVPIGTSRPSSGTVWRGLEGAEAVWLAESRPVRPANWKRGIGDGARAGRHAHRADRLGRSGGKLTLAPQIKNLDGALALEQPAGVVLKNVQITPEMCNEGLKFVAPLVAQATRAEGSLSLDTTSRRVPLADAAAMQVSGHLSMHQLQVAAGADSKEIIVLAQQVKQLVTKQPPLFNANEVTFLTMADENMNTPWPTGAVYHRGLTMQAGDVVIRTSGSVGFDDTLALVVEIPIQDQWFGNGPAAAILKGQSVKLPVRGTFAKWEIDRQGFSQLAADLAKGVAGNAIREGINKGLERLLQPK